jgi:hypothetical protein
MDCPTFAEKLARTMLATDGIGVIWKLHMDACTLHRVGNDIAAASFIEIAEAAERIAAAPPV